MLAPLAGSKNARKPLSISGRVTKSLPTPLYLLGEARRRSSTHPPLSRQLEARPRLDGVGELVAQRLERAVRRQLQQVHARGRGGQPRRVRRLQWQYLVVLSRSGRGGGVVPSVQSAACTHGLRIQCTRLQHGRVPRRTRRGLVSFVRIPPSRLRRQVDAEGRLQPAEAHQRRPRARRRELERSGAARRRVLGQHLPEPAHGRRVGVVAA